MSEVAGTTDNPLVVCDAAEVLRQLEHQQLPKLVAALRTVGYGMDQ